MTNLTFENCPNCLCQQPVTAANCGICGTNLAGTQIEPTKQNYTLRTVLFALLATFSLGSAAIAGFYYSKYQNTEEKIDGVHQEVTALKIEMKKMSAASLVDMSDEIEELSQKIDDVQDDVGKIKTSIGEVETEVSDIASDISSVQMKIGY